MSRRDAIARLPGHAAALDLDAKLVLSGEPAGTTQTWSARTTRARPHRLAPLRSPSSGCPTLVIAFML